MLEDVTAAVGHYPELRSGIRGNEPETVAYGYYNGDGLLFVHSERASTVTVLDVSKPTDPKVQHVLPVGTSPAGGLAIPHRGLYVAASELDLRSFGIRSAITIYQRGFSDISYPTLIANDREDDGTPIPWGSLSGLAADIRDSSYGVRMGGAGRSSKGGGGGKSGNANYRASILLYAVMDNFYRKSRILTIEGMESPSTVIEELFLNDTFNWIKTAPMAFPDLINQEDNSVNLDLEGIAISKFGGFWVVSEGQGGGGSSPVTQLNHLVRVAPDGNITFATTLPDEVNALQTPFGFHGVAEGSDDFENVVVVAFQRAWGDEAHPRLGAFDQMTREWTFYFYPLDAPESQNDGGGWVGVSDLSPLGEGGEFYVMERDNQSGPDAAVKRIYKIDLGLHTPGSVVTKTLVRNILPDIAEQSGAVPEKFEGMALDSYGDIWIVNDNDGANTNSGETLLLSLEGLDDYEPVW